MRKRIALATFACCFVTMMARHAQAQAPVVTVFKGANFTGESRSFAVGSAPLDASWARTIASVKVPRGLRLTLCETGNLRGVCRSYTAQAAVLDPAIAGRGAHVRVDQALWGFADLHVHPAAHFAFGAANNGTNGVFWGNPGFRLEDSDRTISRDLGPCDASKHGGEDFDLIRHSTRGALVGQLVDLGKELGGLPHGRGGWPNFESWPNALNVPHQQMHVSWLRRAYDGGLRLMVANAADTQALSMLWHRSVGATEPRFDPTHDFEVAKRQLTFIKDFARANSSWMQIVQSPAEARAAVSSNRLAVILGLEMDSLTIEQVLALKRDHGVRHVIPIHLVDNTFGGTAVYVDVFNASNYFTNGRFWQVTSDPHLTFRLGRPQYLRYIAPTPLNVISPIGGFLASGVGLGEMGGMMKPTHASDDVYRTLRYGDCTGTNCPGHRNARLTTTDLFKTLMQNGLIVDIVHASDQAQQDVTALAERYGYPLMNSHSDLRRDDAITENERAMRTSLAERISKHGGVLGFGTGGGSRSGTIPMVRIQVPPANRHLTRAASEWTSNLHVTAPERGRFEIHVVTKSAQPGCAPNQDKGGELCYPKCRVGYHGIGPMCHKDCPAGFRDDGLHCAKPQPYGRGPGFPMNVGELNLNGAAARCQAQNAQGCEQSGLVIYPKCRGGFHAVGCCVCTPDCPSGMTDIGISCQKNGSEGRGAGTPVVNYPPPDGALAASLNFPGSNPGSSMRMDAQPQEDGTYLFRSEILVPHGATLRHVSSIGLRLVGGTALDVQEIRVTPVKDSMQDWAQAFLKARRTMAGAVALGTDMNGFATEIAWYDGTPLHYPLRVTAESDFRTVPSAAPISLSYRCSAHQVPGPPASPGGPPVTCGTPPRSWRFEESGLSHYGLFPEFLQAARNELAEVGQAHEIEGLFHSANDVIQLWERAEQASHDVR